MATSLDVTQFTAKERRAARRDLLKKIEDYNKQMKRTRKPSFPLSNPSNVSAVLQCTCSAVVVTSPRILCTREY